jgi:5-methylcytosine-specific restriction endonuclease McrA
MLNVISLSTESTTALPTLVPSPPNVQELERLGDEIATLSAHLDAATARLLALIREFDARGGWNTGFRSCAEWLAWRVGMDLGAARERVRVARALPTLPHLSEALANGELSYAKVRALTRVATPETEVRLLSVGRAGTAAHVERIVRGWRRMDRQAEAREAARQHAGRALHVYQVDDGTVVVRGRLSPEAGALLLRALDAARETLYQRARAGSANATDPAIERPTRAQQQADALALLVETALHHDLDPGAPGERYQVVVHVDAQVLEDASRPGQSVLEEVGHVSAETSQRLACDASRVVMRHDHHGRLVEVGARTRTIPPALRRALLHRDRTCRFPGCEARVGQGHHIQHWAHGGPTTLANLVLLCRRHHRAVHEEGYQIEHGMDGSLEFRRPDGRPLPHVLAPPVTPHDPARALLVQHEAMGLRIHSRTACPAWAGERLDIGWALSVLHPEAGARDPERLP